MSKTYVLVKDGIVQNIISLQEGTLFNTDCDMIEITSEIVEVGFIYELKEITLVEEVRGGVQNLISEATYDQYGDEVSPATYSFDPDGVIVARVTEFRHTFTNPASLDPQLEQQRISIEARAYLAATDWMVIRAAERGVSLSAEFRAERDAARAKVI